MKFIINKKEWNKEKKKDKFKIKSTTKNTVVVEGDELPEVKCEKLKKIDLHSTLPYQGDFDLCEVPEMKAIINSSSIPCIFMDTGARMDHYFYSDLITDSYDAVTDLAVTKDSLELIGGHGTRGVSITAGVGGVVREAPLIIINWFDWNNPNNNEPNIIECFNWLFSKNIQKAIVRCSWGFMEYSEALEDCIRQCDENEIIILATTGNQYIDLTNIRMYPAEFSKIYKNVLAIAGCDFNEDIPAATGVSGPTNVFAPAWPGIWSADAKSSYGISGQSGVSHHCVQGIAAAIWQANPNLTAHEVVDIIKLSVDKKPQYVACTSGGRINAERAVIMANSYVPSLPDDNFTGSISLDSGTLIVKNGLIKSFN